MAAEAFDLDIPVSGEFLLEVLVSLKGGGSAKASAPPDVALLVEEEQWGTVGP